MKPLVEEWQDSFEPEAKLERSSAITPSADRT